VGVEIAFVGVAPLHQGFFADADARAQLGRELAGRVADPARLVVAYDAVELRGAIQLDLHAGSLRTPVRRSESHLQLADLAPLTMALATYRSSLAARYDYRIQNFSVRLFAIDGTTSCQLGITGGNPPDGRTLSPCVHINGVERCGTPDGQGVSFNPEVARDLARCLGS